MTATQILALSFAMLGDTGPTDGAKGKDVA